jgi:hypothetical protein
MRAKTGLMLRAAGVLVAGSLVVASLAASQSDARGRRARAVSFAGGWRVQTVVARKHFVSDTQVAVSESGAAVLGWIQGRPPATCSQSPCDVPGPPFRGFAVMASQGTAAGGFGRPIHLSSNGGGHIFAAQLSSGISYVAWDPWKGEAWRIAAIDQGRLARPTVLPADAQLQGVFTGPEQEAAAVWATAGRPWHLHYAFLDPAGRLGRRGILTVLRGSEFSYPSIAMNDRGDLAAAWTAGPGEFTDPGFMALCDAQGHCTGPRRLPLPPAYLSVSVALTDSGAAFVLEGSHSGIRATIAHVDQAKIRTLRVSATGDWPLVVPDGPAGAAATFMPSETTTAQTFFDPSTARFTRPTMRSYVANGAFPQVAASLSGRSVFTWPGSCCLRARIGSGTRLGPGTNVPASSGANLTEGFNAEIQQGPSVQNIGIDGRGDAAFTWDGFANDDYHGLYVALHRTS